MLIFCSEKKLNRKCIYRRIFLFIVHTEWNSRPPAKTCPALQSGTLLILERMANTKTRIIFKCCKAFINILTITLTNPMFALANTAQNHRSLFTPDKTSCTLHQDLPSFLNSLLWQSKACRPRCHGRWPTIASKDKWFRNSYIIRYRNYLAPNVLKFKLQSMYHEFIFK